MFGLTQENLKNLERRLMQLEVKEMLVSMIGQGLESTDDVIEHLVEFLDDVELKDVLEIYKENHPDWD